MGTENKLMITRLKEEMQRAGINARQLSDMANVGKSFVYDILSGKSSNPTTNKLSAIADALGVSVPYLIAGNCNNNPMASQTNKDYVLIPILSADGDDNDNSHSNSVPYRKEWITNQLNIPTNNLRAAIITGDSMAPSLYNNDIVLIDVTKNTPTPPGIFMISDGVGLLAKRLEYIKVKGKSFVLVKSDNPKYHSYESQLEEINIIGRIIWFSHSMI